MALAPNMGSDPRMLIALEAAYMLADLIFDSGDTISWDECRQSLISKLNTWKQGDALPLFMVFSALRSVVRFDQESRQIKGMYNLNCPDSKAISIAIDLRLDLELVCSKVHCPAPSLGCYRCLWHGTMNQVDKAHFSTRSWCSFPWLPLLMKGWIEMMISLWLLRITFSIQYAFETPPIVSMLRVRALVKELVILTHNHHSNISIRSKIPPNRPTKLQFPPPNSTHQ